MSSSKSSEGSYQKVSVVRSLIRTFLQFLSAGNSASNHSQHAPPNAEYSNLIESFERENKKGNFSSLNNDSSFMDPNKKQTTVRVKRTGGNGAIGEDFAFDSLMEKASLDSVYREKVAVANPKLKPDLRYGKSAPNLSFTG